MQVRITMEEVERHALEVYERTRQDVLDILKIVGQAARQRAAAIAKRAAAAVAWSAAEQAEAVATRFRERLEGRPELLDRPYSRTAHLIALIFLPFAELTASVAAFSGAVGVDGVERVGLPVGLVVGIIVTAHSLGPLLKGLHVAHAVRQLPPAKREELPPAEFFGSSPWWLTATALGATVLLVAPAATFLVRQGVSDAAGATPGFDGPAISPAAFALITLVIVIAATVESFIWANPWLQTLDEHEQFAERLSAAAHRAAAEAEQATMAATTEEGRRAVVPKLDLDRIQTDIDIAEIHRQAAAAKGDDEQVLVRDLEVQALHRHLARASEAMGAIPGPDS